MLDWLKGLFAGGGQGQASPGTTTVTCKYCGKTFTLPENVQHWPDCCQACRAKHRTAERVTRRCRGCGKEFSFDASAGSWPKYCPACRARRGR